MIHPLSTIARPLASVARALWPYLRRVYQERQAGQMPFSVDTDVLEHGVDATLDRLCGGNIDETWWHNLLNCIGHPFIAPDFLRMPALQEWLADEQVQSDVKALARQRILGADEDDPETQTRLRRAYAAVTGEDERLADGPIAVVLAILAAGYVGSIAPQLQPIAGMIQASTQQHREQFSTLQRILNERGPDHHVVAAHSEQAERALSLLLKQRSLTPDRVRQALITLAQRVTDDLRYVERAIRAKVLYWAARLHAVQHETLPITRHYLVQLRQTDPSVDTRIIDALILEAENNSDGALQMLRDIDTPDGRATFFSTLFRTRGAETALAWFDNQPGRDHARFLTGLGWSNVAICLVKTDRWEEAAARLAAAQEHREEWPDLAFVEGVINAALLLPVEWRQYALEMHLFYEGLRPIEGVDAIRRRARAKICFETAKALLMNIEQPERAQAAQDWLLWLRLTDPMPAVASEARQEIQAAIHDGQRAVELIPFARVFGIAFDDTPLQRYLIQRKLTGGLSGRELVAEFLLAELRINPRDRAEFLEREEERLSQVIAKASLVGKRIEALVQDGQGVRARHLLEACRDIFVDYDYERLRTLIDTQEGRDPRAQLEALYRQTEALIDLKNLISHLTCASDWAALQPLLQELFRRERTVENALQLVASMWRHPHTDDTQLLAFLEENQEMVDRSRDLASMKAWTLFHVGRLQEAEALNRSLLGARQHHNDLLLETNLAIQSGDWERFAGIISRVWPTREELEPSVLMRLALLAAEADTTAHRASELATLAAGKAAADPQILMGAYILAVQLGHETETEAAWLTRASELSSEEGPVWQVSTRTIVEEMMPKRRARGREIEQALLHGKMPLHTATRALNQPLSRFLLDIPRNNVDQPDGRRRTLVPIVSGARQMVQMHSEWVVGLDITSLMVLGYLELLKKTLTTFQRVVLAPETMTLLLNERRQVRFHQPSRVKEAEEIRALIDQGHLKMGQSLPQPPAWLVKEIGRDLAELLEAARVTGGQVVRPYPIFKLQTFLEREADLQEYAALVLSTKAFTSLLSAGGHIDSQAHERACRFLTIQDPAPPTEADPSLLERRIYLDDLAVGYLQTAGILQAACRCRLDLWVHPSMKEEQAAIIEANREGERLVEALDDIRVTLRDALERGQAIFMPRHRRHEEETQLGWLYHAAPTVAHILRDAGPCDAVCVDDRFLNRHHTLTDTAEHTVPIVCVLDLLQHLEMCGVMNTEDKHRASHKLRQAGYSFVPVTLEELEQYLRQARCDHEGHVIESAEMRVLRQTLMRVRSLDMVEMPTEAPFLEKMQFGCMVAIRRLWTDEAVSAERAVALSQWVWCSIAPSPMDWARTLREPLRQSDMPEAFARYLALLLRPMHVPMERYEVFRNWVECEVLAPLLPANACLLDSIVQLVRTDIEHLSEELNDDASDTPS
jgi:hypothetical protein